MASLFEGTPQTASSYVTSTTEMPKWLQDAIYNQIQWSQNIANKPYEQYSAPTVAEMNPMQTQAYNQVSANQGVWQPNITAAQQGMQGLTTSNTANPLQAAQNQYTNPSLAASGLQAGQNLYGQASGLNAVSAASPYLNQASSYNALSAANPYLSQAANTNIQGAGQSLYNQAASMNAVNAASPYMSQAASATGQALGGSSLEAANPYLQQAGQSSVQNIDQYMNPYQQNVLDTIAKQGARNLSENILPKVSDAFIRAGQFGSSQMGELGSRAVRDTQEAVLNAQSQAAQQGYSQALNAAQSDLARQSQLASTAGGLSGTDLSRTLQAGSQYANLGQQQGQLTGQQQSALANLGQAQTSAAAQQAQQYANIGQQQGQLSSQQLQNLLNLGQAQGQLTSQQMQNLANLGQLQTAAGQTQQQYGLNAAQAAQAAQTSDYARQLSALQNMAAMAQQQQQMGYTDTAALEAAGQAQQALQQKQLDAAKAQYTEEQLYPRQQMDWLSTITRGLAPITPQSTSSSTNTVGQTYSASPLSQLATGLGTAAGLSKMLS